MIATVPFSMTARLISLSGLPSIEIDFRFMNPISVGNFVRLLFSQFKFYNNGSVYAISTGMSESELFERSMTSSSDKFAFLISRGEISLIELYARLNTRNRGIPIVMTELIFLSLLMLKSRFVSAGNADPPYEFGLNPSKNAARLFYRNSNVTSD